MAGNAADSTTPDKTPPWSASFRWIAPLLVYKAGLLSLMYIGLILIPMFFWRYSTEKAIWHSETTFAEACSTWDAAHYLRISQIGYDKKYDDANFFPLWPGCIRLLTCAGLDYVPAAITLAILFSTGAAIILHRLAMLRYGAAAAENTVLLLCAFPTAFLFCLPYSESLFLLLCVGLFLAFHLDRVRWIYVCGFLLVLSRPVGFFCIAPIFLDQLLKHRRGRAVVLATAPVAGLLCYFTIMKIMAGDPLANVHVAVHAIAAPTLTRFLHPVDFLNRFFDPPGGLSVHGFLTSTIDRGMFVIVLFCLYFVARKSLVDLSYALPLAVVTAVTEYMISYTRYALVVFPIYLAMGEVLNKPRLRPWLFVILGLSFALQIILMVMHTHGYWAG